MHQVPIHTKAKPSSKVSDACIGATGDFGEGLCTNWGYVMGVFPESAVVGMKNLDGSNPVKRAPALRKRKTWLRDRTKSVAVLFPGWVRGRSRSLAYNTVPSNGRTGLPTSDFRQRPKTEPRPTPLRAGTTKKSECEFTR